MTPATVLGCIAFLAWLAGIGLLAHVIPAALAEDDFMSMAMRVDPERVAVVFALVIVGWPLTGPAMAIMKVRQKRER